MPHRRRGSIVPGTSPATSLFNRRDSVAAAVTPPTAMYATGDPQRDRRFSVSAALGLANFRRSSTSTTAEESAIEDDASPISRRMSMQPTRAYGGMSGGSPTSGNDDPSFFSTLFQKPVAGVSVVGNVKNKSSTPTVAEILASATGGRPIERRGSIAAVICAGLGGADSGGGKDGGGGGNGGGNPASKQRRGSASIESVEISNFDGGNESISRERRGSWTSSSPKPLSVSSTQSNVCSPTQDQVPYDWSANLRARAQSSVGGIRPVFGLMPQSDDSAPTSRVSPKQQAPAYMAPPPSQPPAPKLTTRESRKPDAYQERILKGDFYMD